MATAHDITTDAAPVVAVFDGGPCPDCEAEGLCRWWCLRLAETVYSSDEE
jgi:hypothetical protein